MQNMAKGDNMQLIENVKKIGKRALPENTISKINQIRSKSYAKKMLRRISEYFSDNPNEAKQYISELSFMRKHGFRVFPYPYNITYVPEMDINYNLNFEMYYVNHLGKSLYFPRGMTKNQVMSYYMGLCKEQHIESPHRYFCENYEVTSEDLFVDVGAAEAMASIEVVSRAKRILIFECDPSWIEALNMTFEPWKNKVEIVCKYVSDEVTENTITLDEKLEEYDGPIFIKMDIEGYEEKALIGAKDTLEKPSTKIVCCTYHKNDSADKIKDFLQQRDMDTTFTNGYMVFHYDKEIAPPFFRKGVIRGCHL